MIWALLAMYFLGAGGVSGSTLTSASVKQLSRQAEVIIVDSERSKVAQLILKELRKEAKSFEKVFARSGRQLTKSYKDHAADLADVTEVLSDLNLSWEASQQRALDLRFALRESMTEEEWTALLGDK